MEKEKLETERARRARLADLRDNPDVCFALVADPAAQNGWSLVVNGHPMQILEKMASSMEALRMTAMHQVLEQAMGGGQPQTLARQLADLRGPGRRG